MNRNSEIEQNIHLHKPNRQPGLSFLGEINAWCGRGDLNPHAFRRHPLKMVCLPVPPLPLVLSVAYARAKVRRVEGQPLKDTP